MSLKITNSKLHSHPHVGPMSQLIAAQWCQMASENLFITDPGHGLSPIQRHANTLTNADLLSIRHLRINSSEIWINISTFSCKKKMNTKMLSAKCWPFCPGGWLITKILCFTNTGIPIVKIRWSYDCLISTTAFPLLVRKYIFYGIRPQVPMG